MIVQDMDYDYDRAVYDGIMDRLNNLTRFGNAPGIEISANMLKELGNPCVDVKYIHVAGTNGKGSVCAFLTSMLMGLGYRVGTFTSPHLIDFEERITVNNEKVSKKEVIDYVSQIEKHDYKLPLTYFDYCLGIAMLHFKKAECDFLVIETGLGGRLDSTNALGTPVASVITKIGFDHMSLLGDTLAKIAKEKAGIIKKDSLVVCENQEEEALDVLIDTFEKINGCKYDAVISQNGLHNDKKCELYVINEKNIEAISARNITMLGVHQWENGAAAFATIELLINRGIIDGDTMTKDELLGCIETTTWPGRMEILKEKPFIMVDGAHNGHGVNALKNSLISLYPKEKFKFYVGVLADKDYRTMIDTLIPIAEEFVTCTPDNYRALQGEQLAEYIEKCGINTTTVNTIPELFDKMSNEYKNIILGSLYFIGEVKAAFQLERF